MTNILESIKQLRELTGVGMMECKKVLGEANGDIEKAIELLRKAGQAKAVKRSGKIAAEGLIGIKSDNGKVAIVEVNSETDFAAKDNNFLTFLGTTLDTIIDAGVSDIDKINSHSIGSDSLETIRTALVSKIGENINVRRAKYFDASNTYATYSHGGKIGVVVQYTGNDEGIAKDISMHIAANNPLVLSSSEISAELIAKEKEIFIAIAIEEGCPEDKVEMRISNQVKKFASQSSLMGQPFVKDPSVTVEKYLEDNSTKVLSFTRFEVGEGIEKKQENFAEEVKAQMRS